jgi:simple sugar transport system permease protein
MGSVISPETEALRTPAETRRSRILGVFYLLMAWLVAQVFAIGTNGDATFRLGSSDNPLDWTVSAQGLAWVVTAILGALAAIHFMRGLGKWTNGVLGVALGMFVLAFLGWAAAGVPDGFSLVGMLQASVIKATPIAFGALSGVMCERVAVINIGIEGMLLTGAFTGAVVGTVVSPFVGIIGASLAGGVMALGLAVLAIRYRVDQIIAGVVINIFALGITSFVSSQVLVENAAELNQPGVLGPIRIPLLADIPLLGRILFNQNIFVYVLYTLVGVFTYMLFRTRWGLRSRSVGEHPKASDTLGIDVFRTRYRNVFYGGLIAGFGGAYFTLGSVGAFNENMTAGRGFIGLAAMIFGRWHPVGALAAALVFGFAESLQIRLSILDVGIPSEFLLMAPYLVTIIVVAGVVGAARPPAADGQPYIKE